MIYSTSDLALATTLSLWYPIKSIMRKDGASRVEFSFDYDDDLDYKIQQYWKSQLKVDPQRFFQQLKILKTRIHQANN